MIYNFNKKISKDKKFVDFWINIFFYLKALKIKKWNSLLFDKLLYKSSIREKVLKSKINLDL